MKWNNLLNEIKALLSNQYLMQVILQFTMSSYLEQYQMSTLACPARQQAKKLRNKNAHPSTSLVTHDIWWRKYFTVEADELTWPFHAEASHFLTPIFETFTWCQTIRSMHVKIYNNYHLCPPDPLVDIDICPAW